MKTLPWHRPARIAEIGDRIWTYLSPASRFEQEGLLTAAALLQWPDKDVARLGDLQFLLSREVGTFLDAVPHLIRTLTTTSTRDEEWDHERLRGPVLWTRTLSLRAGGGSPSLWVTAPARRNNQTPENEMLVHVLDAIVEIGRRSGWEARRTESEPSQRVRSRLASAEFWQQSRPLQQIERRHVTPRDAMKVRSGRAKLRYDPIIAAYDRHEALVGRLDRQAVREAVEQVALVSTSEGTLFELLCLFNMIDALSRLGWKMSDIGLFHGAAQLRGSRTDGRRLDMTYQSAPSSLTADSVYHQVLTDHQFKQNQPLRPDMVVRWEDSARNWRWLLVECKLSESQGLPHAARQALVDLLAYRRAFDAVLDATPAPYGLGLAWGEGLVGSTAGEVRLCTPDRIAHTLADILL